MCDCHLPGYGDDLATLARRLVDACGPFPGDSWLHDVAATGLPPQPRSLEPLIPDAWGLRLLDSVREHARHAEQVAARLRLDHLFQRRGSDDTIRIRRPHTDTERERTPLEQLTHDTRAAAEARIDECLVTGEPARRFLDELASAPPEPIDPYTLLEEARAAIDALPEQPRRPVKIRASQWARLRARDTLRGHGVPDNPYSRAAEQLLAGVPVEVVDDEPLPPIRVYDIGDREHLGPMATVLREQRAQLARLTPADVTKIIAETVTTTGATDPDGTLRATTATEYRLQRRTTDENGPNPDLPEQPQTTHQQPETITNPEPRYTSPLTTSPSPAQTPDEAPENPGHTGSGHHRAGGGSR